GDTGISVLKSCFHFGCVVPFISIPNFGFMVFLIRASLQPYPRKGDGSGNLSPAREVTVSALRKRAKQHLVAWGHLVTCKNFWTEILMPRSFSAMEPPLTFSASRAS